MARQLAAVIDNGTGYTKMGYHHHHHPPPPPAIQSLPFLADVCVLALRATTRPPLSSPPQSQPARPPAPPPTVPPRRQSPPSSQVAPVAPPPDTWRPSAAPRTWISLLEMRLFRRMLGRDTGWNIPFGMALYPTGPSWNGNHKLFPARVLRRLIGEILGSEYFQVFEM
jgi:hypothetical protein